MIELPQAQFSRVASLFAFDQPNRTMIFATVEGRTPGKVCVDNCDRPRQCLLVINMDCKELVAGSTLYLPIAVEGALFSVGDGHAAQADGEVNGTGIECPMARVELTFDLRDDLLITTPRANTPTGWITLGFDPDRNHAYDNALWSMIDLMTELYGITRLNALSLSSLLVEMRVTQRVNGTNGVHALLPHGACQSLASTS